MIWLVRGPAPAPDSQPLSSRGGSGPGVIFTCSPLIRLLPDLDCSMTSEDNAPHSATCGSRGVGVIAMRRLAVIVALGAMLGMLGGDG